jgi:ribosomal subunit interface protein
VLPTPVYREQADQRSQGEKEPVVITTVSGRHMDVTEPLKNYAEQKTDKLHKYFDRIQEIEVIFDNGKDEVQVEMIVNAEHKAMFVAHHKDGDAYASPSTGASTSSSGN